MAGLVGWSSSSIIKLARVKPKRHLSRAYSHTSPLTNKSRPESHYGRMEKGWSRSSSFWVFVLSRPPGRGLTGHGR